jgi:hypothetical protein
MNTAETVPAIDARGNRLPGAQSGEDTPVRLGGKKIPGRVYGRRAFGTWKRESGQERAHFNDKGRQRPSQIGA